MSVDFGKLLATHRAYFPIWRHSPCAMARKPVERTAIDDEGPRRGLLCGALDRPPQKPHRSGLDRREVHDQRDRSRAWPPSGAGSPRVPVSTPFQLAPSHAEVRFDPLGVGLIIGTWNYPVMLTLSPLIAAIAAGNAAVIKPSEVSAATAGVDRALPSGIPGPQRVLRCARAPCPRPRRCSNSSGITSSSPAARPWPGSSWPRPARNLTPVVLELGGKNPTIVHSSANLRVAARRIAFGALVQRRPDLHGAGPRLVFKDVAEQFLAHLKEALVEFYGDNPQASPDYGRIVSTHHFDRLVSLLQSGTIFHGGQHDRDDRFIAPTVLVHVAQDSPAMQQEIFWPDIARSGSEQRRAGDRLRQRSAESARPLCVRRRQVLHRASPGSDGLRRCRGQRLHASARCPRSAVRRRGEFRHGQIPRRVGASAPTPTRAESCRTARASTSEGCATHPTTATGSCAIS